MRALDAISLQNKIKEYVTESRKNINSKIKMVNSFLQQMKDENEQVISNRKL